MHHKATRTRVSLKLASVEKAKEKSAWWSGVYYRLAENVLDSSGRIRDLRYVVRLPVALLELWVAQVYACE